MVEKRIGNSHHWNSGCFGRLWYRSTSRCSCCMISLLGYVFSFLGDPRIWIILSVLTFAVRMVYRKKKIDKLLWTRAFIIFVGVSMGLAFLSSVVLKDIFQIPRPCSFSESDSNFSPYCL